MRYVDSVNVVKKCIDNKFLAKFHITHWKLLKYNLLKKLQIW